MFGPLVWGLDPSGAVLRSWGLDDSPDGLDRFVDVALEAAVGAVGLVKPQSAFYERHGWRGIRTLGRLVAEARQAGLLVILDAKRGDVGSTNDAYAEAFLGADAAIPVDALTVHPYLGFGAMDAFVERAHLGGQLPVGGHPVFQPRGPRRAGRPRRDRQKCRGGTLGRDRAPERANWLPGRSDRSGRSSGRHTCTPS